MLKKTNLMLFFTFETYISFTLSSLRSHTNQQSFNILSFIPLSKSPLSMELDKYYHTENDDENPFICSQPRENGRRDCHSVPKLYEEGGIQCNLDMYSYNSTDNTTCVNWNQYYTNCSAGPVNPFKGAINFDNICYAWIAIFQVRQLIKLPISAQ